LGVRAQVQIEGSEPQGASGMRRLRAVRGPEGAEITTRDGVRLMADIRRPAAPGRFPVLLMRPRSGRRIASTVAYAHPAFHAARGFVLAMQDMRGAGEFLAIRERGRGRRRRHRLRRRVTVAVAAAGGVARGFPPPPLPLSCRPGGRCTA
jgi:hypothetical protein